MQIHDFTENFSDVRLPGGSCNGRMEAVMKIKETIRQFIAMELAAGGGNGFISDNDLLLEQGIIDSFGIMSLLSFLEEKFAVHIEGDELTPENFSTISTISDLIDRKAGTSAGA